MGKKGDFIDFDSGMVVGDRRACPSISETWSTGIFMLNHL